MIEAPQTVLVVDDEDTVRALLNRLLSRAGYRVLAAADGEEALQVWLAHPQKIDLVITDAVMPRRTGAQLIEALQALDPAVKVLLVSGFASQAQQTLDQVNVPFLSKPFTAPELIAAVQSVLPPVSSP